MYFSSLISLICFPWKQPRHLIAPALPLKLLAISNPATKQPKKQAIRMYNSFFCHFQHVCYVSTSLGHLFYFVILFFVCKFRYWLPCLSSRRCSVHDVEPKSLSLPSTLIWFCFKNTDIFTVFMPSIHTRPAFREPLKGKLQKVRLTPNWVGVLVETDRNRDFWKGWRWLAPLHDHSESMFSALLTVSYLCSFH